MICIMIFDWILLLHVFMQQEQGLFITYTSAEGIWDLHVRLINISKKIYKGRFPFKQNFRKVGMRGNGTEISSRKSFQKSRTDCLISEFQTIQPKILEIPGAKLNGKHPRGVTHLAGSSFFDGMVTSLEPVQLLSI